MRDHIREKAQAGNVVVRTCYQTPDASDVQDRDYVEARLIDAEWIAHNTPIRGATSYLCGPRPFLRALVSARARNSMPLGHVRYEFFGPADELLAA